MDRLSILADEHVPRVFTNALRSNGFDVTTAQERYGQESIDGSIFADYADEGIVVVTNDRDFVRMADERDHAGVIVYTDRRFLLDDPLDAAEPLSKSTAITLPTRYRTPSSGSTTGSDARQAPTKLSTRYPTKSVDILA